MKKKSNKKEIVVVDNTPGSKMHNNGKKELVVLVSQLREIKQTIGVHFYELGFCLMEIRDKKLWKYSKFSSFCEFVEHEKISRQTAYNMIAVAKNLTKDDAKDLGPALSYAVAKAKDESTKCELLELAKQGVPAHDLKKIVSKKNNMSQKKPKKKVKGNVQVHSSNGETRCFEVTTDELKEKTTELKSKTIVDDIFDLKPIPKGKPKVKHGWEYRTTCKLNNNFKCDIEVNIKNKKIRIHIR